MKKNGGYILFIVLILLACMVPSVGMFFGEEAETGGNEVLTPPPSLHDRDGALNTSYLTDLSSYAEDNYFLRQQFVTLWSAINQNLLGTSIADNVLLGRGGWLYFTETLNDYTGIDCLSEREIFSAAHNLALMAEYCQSQGAQFLFTIAPNKNSVYPDYMPDVPVFSLRRNADALYDALETDGTPCLRLSDAFESADDILYFTQDSHWNSKGAALAADWINAALGQNTGRSYYGDAFAPEADHLSDLYSMLYPAGKRLETDYKYTGELSFTYDAPIRSAKDMTIMTTGQGNGSLLMFRDSFGELLYPYLADSFSNALFSRSAAYRLDLIEERQADYVVIELVERNINYLLQYVPVMPAPVRDAPEAVSPPENPAPPALDVAPSRDLEGYVLASGKLPLSPLGGSKVFLCVGDTCYEAFLMEERGFALYVPEEALTAGGLSLVFTTASGEVSVPVAL